MIFQHTWQAVVDGRKTQTRRIVKHGEYLLPKSFSGEYQKHVYVSGIDVNAYSDRLKWEVGRTYAVQPGRGKKQVARIRLTDIRREDVRHISDDDALAEYCVNYNHGDGTVMAFRLRWIAMHDKQLDRWLDDGTVRAWGQSTLNERPDELYQAWALTFELVETYPDRIAALKT